MADIRSTVITKEGRIVEADKIAAAIRERLCALPEETALSWFRAHASIEVDRLALLLFMTTVTIQRPPGWDYAAVRAEHETTLKALKSGIGPLVTNQECFGCLRGGRLFHHHIIEVQHGGSNVAGNKVHICFTCHKYLHPWLQDPHPHAAAGWTHISDVFPSQPKG